MVLGRRKLFHWMRFLTQPILNLPVRRLESMMKPWIALVLILWGGGVVWGQTAPQIQEFYAQISPDTPNSYFDLYGMEAGQTVYLYAESEAFDPLVAICDIECEEILARNDDAFEGNSNSALEYTFPEDGDYSVVVTDCCDEAAEGVFRLQISLNAPEVLEGTALATGAEIAIPYEPTFIDMSREFTTTEQVQEFIGAVSPATPFLYYDLFDIPAGQTIYLYLESEAIDPRLVICDINCDEVIAENDDLASDNFNSALEYTFEADGDYSIAVSDCCNRETAEGDFRLLVGYDAPAVLTGEAVPNGAEIAIPYKANASEEPTVAPTPTLPTLTTEDRCAELESVAERKACSLRANRE